MILIKYHYIERPPQGGVVHMYSRKVFQDDDIEGVQKHLDTLAERESIDIIKI